MTDRIPCCVPFCKRTAPRSRHPSPDAEIICGKCWRRSVSQALRARRRALRQRGKRIHRLIYKFGLQGDEAACARLWAPLDRAWARNWEACKKAAIEAAGGIG